MLDTRLVGVEWDETMNWLRAAICEAMNFKKSGMIAVYPDASFQMVRVIDVYSFLAPDGDGCKILGGGYNHN